MARNREPVKPVESQSESGEEEEEESSDSEPEPTLAQTATRKAPPPPPSSSEEESGSESESESDGPDPNAKAVAPKPAAEETPKSARSKPKSPEPVPPAKSAASKRLAEDDPATASKDAKKSKKAAAEPETSEKKSNLFQRLWTEDDEIVILEGMIDYVAKNKSDPISDLNGFHNFIKKNLHADFTRTQLQDKIRRLKKKYVNNKSKGKEGKFSKPHEQAAYELSKSIWGVKEGVKENGGVAKKKPAVVSGEGEGAEAVKMNSNLSMNSNFNSNSTMEERMLGAGEEVFGLGKGVEGEKEWQKLRKEELQLYLKHLEMRVAQTKLVLGVMEGRK